jgi:hypothetical protein
VAAGGAGATATASATMTTTNVGGGPLTINGGHLRDLPHRWGWAGGPAGEARARTLLFAQNALTLAPLRRTAA